MYIQPSPLGSILIRALSALEACPVSRRGWFSTCWLAEDRQQLTTLSSENTASPPQSYGAATALIIINYLIGHHWLEPAEEQQIPDSQNIAEPGGQRVIAASLCSGKSHPLSSQIDTALRQAHAEYPRVVSPCGDVDCKDHDLDPRRKKGGTRARY